MELKDFLESGLLETYVLGQCSPEEIRTVEAMLAAHPEARAEKQAVESVLQKYALATAIAPPAWMKGRIMDLIAEVPTAPPAVPTGSSGFGKMIPGLLLAGIFAALWFLNRNEIGQQRAEIQNLRTQVADCATRDSVRQRLEQQVNLLNHPATRRVELRSADGSDASLLAVVFDNPQTRQTMLGLTQLPALPADRDYQLWVIAEGNAAPQPMDVFQPDGSGGSAQLVDFHAGAQAFAVSVEPKGGSPNGVPTTVLMLGKV